MADLTRSEINATFDSMPTDFTVHVETVVEVIMKTIKMVNHSHVVIDVVEVVDEVIVNEVVKT